MPLTNHLETGGSPYLNSWTDSTLIMVGFREMKKLLGILVLGLVVCNTGFAVA